MAESVRWEKKIKSLIKSQYPEIQILETNVVPKKRADAPQLLIVLGGDGTILEATQKFEKWNPLILGLNLGHVGFLASIRDKKDFIKGLASVMKKEYRTISKMMISAQLFRKNSARGRKKIFSGYALNDIVIQSLLGIVDIGVYIENHPVQYIKGSGVLVATATGSTAYNLSAHGPIVMPDIKCFIVTEIMDHNIPTPSVVVKRNCVIVLTVEDFRKKNQLILKETGESVDVVLSVDGSSMVALKRGDKIIIKQSERLMRFVELEKNYFFKSLQEKFAFK